jgi:hypothetical protein
VPCRQPPQPRRWSSSRTPNTFSAPHSPRHCLHSRRAQNTGPRLSR